MKQTVDIKRVLLACGMGLSVVACAADANDEGVSASAPGVSAQADASGASASAGPVDVSTAQLALDELSGNVDVTVDEFGTASVSSAASVPPPPGADPAVVNGDTATQNIQVACAEGGEAGVDGYVNVAPAPVLVDVKVSIAFDGCTSATGTTVSGDLEFSQTVVTGPGVPLQVETLYQGDVTLSGRVNVSCPVDINVLVDETGQAVEIGGTFCGQDAAELNLRLRPRWQAQ